MPPLAKQVRTNRPISKAKLHSAIAAGWARVCHDMGKGSFADAMDADPCTINRAITGPSLPSAEHLLNSLAADCTALDEVLRLYNLRAVPDVAAAANDSATVAGISHLLAEWLDALRDGCRDHRETCHLADHIRPLIMALSGVVNEADRIRGAA